MVVFKMKCSLPTGGLSLEMPTACQFSGPSKSPSFIFRHFSISQPMLTVTFYTHHLFLNKSPYLYQELKIQPLPNSTYCLLPSTELSSQADKDSLSDKELEQEDELMLNTVNYLKKSGFSEEDAIYVAERIITRNKRSSVIAAKGNKVLAILREHGFSSAQIIKTIVARPTILLACPQKVILPKLKFLESIGFKRGTSLGEIVARVPRILKTSLEKKLVPNYDVVKDVVDLDYELVLKVIRKGTRTESQTDKDSSSDKELEQEDELELNTVNYLKESGFLEEDAIYVAKRIITRNKRFSKIAAKVNEVLAIFREHGFSSDQIINTVKGRPTILLASPRKVILPKLEFLESIGFKRGTSLGEIVARDPSLLITSLEKKLIPNYDVANKVLDSDFELVLKVIKKCTSLIQVDLRTTLIPNIEVLRDAGVPKSKIDYLINNPAPLTEKHSKFRQAVIWVKEMGFDPSKIIFLQAVVCLSWRGYPLVWARCYEKFLEIGCSEDEIIKAFKIKPSYMMVSEEKIKTVVDFLVNKLGWPISDIKKPFIFVHSFEKKIIPRCSVVLYLHSKGFLKKKLPKLTKLLTIPNHMFIEKYLTGHAETVPEVLKIFEGELNFLGE